MGILTKSNPQSVIQRKSSSVDPGRDLPGSGEKKSSRLNPFHFGRVFPALAGLENARAEFPATLIAPVSTAVFFKKSRRSVFFIILVLFRFSIKYQFYHPVKVIPLIVEVILRIHPVYKHQMGCRVNSQHMNARSRMVK